MVAAMRKRSLIGLTLLLTAAMTVGCDADAYAAGCPTVVAHRALAPGAAENTLKGIITANANAVEIDVQRTSDGHLVLMHDTSLTRTTNVENVYPDRSPWYVKNFTVAQVQALGIPTLSEALDAAWQVGKMVQVEIKNPYIYPGIDDQLATDLAEYPNLNIQVISFDEKFLKAFKAQYFGYETVWIINRQPRVLDVRMWTDYIAVAQSEITSAYVKRAQSYGIGTQAYVVNWASTAQRMQTYGVAGFTSNAPVRTAGALSCQ